MSETAPAPPTRPMGARRWPWVVIPLLAVSLYVGAYVWMRAQPDDFICGERSSGEWEVLVSNDRTDRRNWSWLLFRPCIAVEEWWLNG